MPRKCSICFHDEAKAINLLLINGLPYRNIAKRFDVDPAALYRHKKNHLAELLAKAGEEKGSDLLLEVNKLWQDEQRLLSAIQTELADPQRPGSYCLHHKPKDLKIVYQDVGGKTRKLKLSTLLKRLEKAGICVEEILSRLNPVNEFHRAQIVLKGLIELKIEMSILQKLDKLEEAARAYMQEEIY